MNLPFRIAALLTLVILVDSATAQTLYKATGNSYLAISGTSTLHEWTMTAKDAKYQVLLEVSPTGTIRSVISLTLSVRSESLKSGHSAMDKNAYSTLRTDSYKNILFEMTSSNVLDKTIQCSGNLTVAGITKSINLEATYRLMPDQSLLITGAKQLKMSDFNVEPPTFMFGTVTTGDEITVSFNVDLVPVKK